jgi:hypothetical protein
LGIEPGHPVSRPKFFNKCDIADWCDVKGVPREFEEGSKRSEKN